MEIDITKDGIIFDGKTINGEINIGKFKEVLGEPRVHEFKPDLNFLEVLRHKYGEKYKFREMVRNLNDDYDDRILNWY